MGRTFKKSPAHIVKELLVQHSLLGEFSGFVRSEPFEPDDTVTVYNTSGGMAYRKMPTGEVDGLNGIQIRVRARDPKASYEKADQLWTDLAQVKDIQVNVDGVAFMVLALVRFGDILPLPPKTDGSDRSIHVFNVQLNAKEL